MAYFKEIVTKAVIGKGKKICSNKYEVIPEHIPNTVLGCWVINHNFSGLANNGIVIVNGSYDINIWYSYDNDTKTAVYTIKENYQEKMNIRLKEESVLNNNSEIIVRSLKQPTVNDVIIENNKVILNIDKELGVEIVGDTKVRVSVSEEEEDYEIVTDDLYNKDIEETIDKEVNEEYLE